MEDSMSNRHARRAAAAADRSSTGGTAPVPALPDTPAGREIRKAVSSHAVGVTAMLDFGIRKFDAAWLEGMFPLMGELGNGFTGFRGAVFDQASRVALMGKAADGSDTTLVGDLLLCPFVGVEAAVLAYAANPGRLSALADSFRASGIFRERAMTIVLPVPVAAEALSVLETGPSAVRSLVQFGAVALLDIVSGRHDPKISEVEAAMAKHVRTRSRTLAPGQQANLVAGAFAVVRVEQMPSAVADANWFSILEDGERRLAGRSEPWMEDASFRDPDFVLLPPARWGKAAASLVCHRAQAGIAFGRLRESLVEDGGVFRELHVVRNPVNGDVLVAARNAAGASEPQVLPAVLAVSDLDETMRILSTMAKTFTLHETTEAFEAALAA
jgi:hypothetical protein